MENTFMLTDELLWDYADGLLEGDEKLRTDAYLRQHPEYQARLRAILAEKKQLSNLPLEMPRTGFAQKVMTAWAAEQAPAKAKASAKANGRDWVLWGIVTAFGVMLFVPFLGSPASAAPGNSWQIPQEYIPHVQFPSFDWAGLLSSALLRNALLFTVALMSLKLLDKYLQLRRLRLSGQ